MSAASFLLSPDRVIEHTIASPATMGRIIDYTESLAIFKCLLDSEHNGLPAARLDHLLQCAVTSNNPLCLTELVAWARSNGCLSELITVVFRQLRRHPTGARLRNRLLDPLCAEAAAVLSGRAN